MTFDITALNQACMGAFQEDVTLHLASGDTVIGGVYNEIAGDDGFGATDALRSLYRLELLPNDAALLTKGTELTVRGSRFAFVSSTPDNGLSLCELRRL